jgi:hypothetical protein
MGQRDTPKELIPPPAGDSQAVIGGIAHLAFHPTMVHDLNLLNPAVIVAHVL